MEKPKLVEGIKRMVDRQRELGKKEEEQKKKELEVLFGERARMHIVVSGKVQGVFFRSFVEKVAQELQITGWARNTEDGKVEIVAEGGKKDLEALLSQCKKGSAWAVVTQVDVKWERFKGEFSEFTH